MTMPLSLRFAGRDLRGGLKGFRIFLACLTLGVAAIAGVGSLSASIRAGIEQNARALLGADVEVRVTGNPATAEQVGWMTKRSRALSLVRGMRTMVRGGTGQTLVELKAVEAEGAAAYPLYGELRLDPPLAFVSALGKQDGVFGAVAEVALLSRLGLKVGDEISIGETQLRLAAVLTHEPDRISGTFALGPRLMISNAALDASGLVQLGSLVRHKYRARLSPADDVKTWAKDLSTAFPAAAWRIFDVDKAQPSVKRFVDRLGLFLTLVGLTALVIGGVGVGNAVQAYLAGKTETIATLKCLGADGAMIFRIYLLEIGGLAALGIAIGLGLGAALPMAALSLLEGQLPVSADLAVFPEPLIRAAAFGALTALAFALWPLARARQVPAAGLFRDVVSSDRRLPPARDLAAIVLAGIGLVVLALTSGEHAGIARWFVLSAGAALAAFWLLAQGIIQILRRLPRARRPGLRMAMDAKPFLLLSAFNIPFIEILGLLIFLSFVKNKGNIEINNNPATTINEDLKEPFVIRNAPIRGPIIAANLNKPLITDISDASCFLSENLVKYIWNEE